MPDIREPFAVVFNKIEGTYGADSVPVAGTDAMLVKNYTLRPLVQALQDRGNLALPYAGSRGRRVIANYVMCTYDIEFAGAGAAGTAPKYAPDLKAAACAETVNAAVSVVYTPISSAVPSVTRYHYLDGVLHKMLGARNRARLVLPEADAPHISIESVGLYVAVTDVAMPTPTLTAWRKPVVINKANSTPYRLHTFDAIWASCELDFGNEIDYVNLPNQEEVKWLDRKARMSLQIAAGTVAQKDWWAIARAETLGAFTFTNGAVAGDIVKADAPNAQLVNPDYVTRNKIRHLRMEADLHPSSAGNDEFSLTIQ